ncbi:MAG: DUF1338 domain-containing protein [Chloroflexota bacterium]
MILKSIFRHLWNDYTEQNPSAKKIYDLFKNEGEEVVNDHIAFRTIDFEDVNINALAIPFIKNGYILKGEYDFEEKHLHARHYEIPGDKTAPRIFLSHLILQDVSPFINEIFREAFLNADRKKLDKNTLIIAGRIFDPISYKTYQMLREESEYAAWFYVFGFRANHFTVSVNSLKKYNSIYKVNDLLKANGFVLNTSGGEVKGEGELLLQSSTMADLVKVDFADGTYEIPSCYYEFAQRIPDENGQIYSGFIAKSADKIFESTNMYQNKK